MINNQFKLVVTVIEAKDLSLNGTVPVVQLLFGNKKKKTKTRNNNSSTCLQWNEVFELPFESDSNELIVRFIDPSPFSRKVLGQCTVKLKEEGITAALNAEKEVNHDVSDGKNCSVGKIRLKCKLAQGPVTKSKVPPAPPKPPSKPNPRTTSTASAAAAAAAGGGKPKRPNSQRPLPNQNTPPIFEFIRTKNVEGLQQFLQSSQPSSVNVVVAKNGNTPLHEACIEREEAILNSLLKYHGIDVNIKNSDDTTPLHYFCEKWQSPDYLESFNLFIKVGADVNASNSNGETPIFKAIFNNSIRYMLLEALIKNSADVNITTKTAKEGVLHYAVRLGRSDLVNLILQARPRLDLKGDEGYTPEELATVYNHPKIAKHLRQVGQLFQWLDDNDLSELKGVFLKNEITLGVLPYVNEDSLKSMGVEPLGLRLRILQACSKVETSATSLDLLKDESMISEDKLSSLENDLRDLDGTGEGIIDGRQIEYIKHLGTGASGDVWEGLYNQVQVAVKVLKVTAEQEIDEFKKEFEVLRTVRNNNVVRFYGAAMKPRLCMVMEYCARRSLFHVVKDETVEIGWERAFSFIKDMCLGLQALHNNVPQILHRDLKSLNLLVTQDWRLKLCDFGLSRFATPENLKTMQQMRGTFAYCDPEIYNGKSFTSASDMYSLGIILWEIVNRVIKGIYEQPYSEYKNIAFDFDIVVKAAKEDLRPTIPVECPFTLKELIGRLLHKNQEARLSLTDLMAKLSEIEKHYKANSSDWNDLIVKN